jgi:DNA mismatch endonuclease (patch repair protein)
MDTRSPEQRSRIMRSVRSQDTGPEMVVRRLVHGMGLRYRLHQKRLPGTPDLVFVRRRMAVFVNGCFWHGHECSKGRLPWADVSRLYKK